jgi:hypothetical protein
MIDAVIMSCFDAVPVARIWFFFYAACAITRNWVAFNKRIRANGAWSVPVPSKINAVFLNYHVAHKTKIRVLVAACATVIYCVTFNSRIATVNSDSVPRATKLLAISIVGFDAVPAKISVFDTASSLFSSGNALDEIVIARSADTVEVTAHGLAD